MNSSNNHPPVSSDLSSSDRHGLSNSGTSTSTSTRSSRRLLAKDLRGSEVQVYRSNSAAGINPLDFTIDKLRFSSLGRLYGREEEVAELKAVIAEQMERLAKFEEQQKKLLEKELQESLLDKNPSNKAKHDDDNNSAGNNKDSNSEQQQPGNLSAIQESEEMMTGSSDDKDDSKPHKSLVCVSGSAGSGKSVLAMKTLSMVRGHRGFFLSGKFHWGDTTRPLEAIANAFDSLCDDLALYKSQQTTPETGCNRWLFSFSEFKKQLTETFDAEELELLHRIIPHLRSVVEVADPIITEPIIHEGRGVSDTDYVGSELRLRITLKRFVKLFCSLGPLVIVLDDCQWIDRPSLELLESLIRDHEIAPITVIANYRDNEVDDQHIFQKAVKGLESDEGLSLSVHRMQAKPLEVDDICALLEDLIDAAPDDTRPLAQCIKSKTDGNALYVREFLLSLHRDELLTFEFRAMRWEWDVENIKVSARVTDNVVNLINYKIKELPALFSRLLPQIACLGCRFPIPAFDAVVNNCVSELEAEVAESYLRSICRHQENEDSGHMDASAAETTTSTSETILLVCEKIGLVSSCGLQSRYYQWEHDNIQQAALCFVPEEESLAFQFEVGKLLFNSLKEEHLMEVLFVVTSLLNSDQEALTKEDDSLRIQIAELNCRFCVAAFYASAFESAAVYSRKGIELLPVDKFDKHYDLALDLYEIAAEAHFSTGDYTNAMLFADEVVELPLIPLLHKRRVYKAKLLSLGGLGRVAEAKDLCVQVLQMLGCRFPRKMKSIHILAGVIKLQSTVESMAKKIDNAKRLEDEQKVWVHDLLDRLVTYSFQAGDTDLLSLTMLKGLSLTAKWGISDKSGPLLASGGLLLAILGNFAGAKKLADLAMKHANNGTDARTRLVAYRHVLHYQVALPACKKALMDGYRSGLRQGDIESALWNIYGHCDDQFTTGAKLSIVIKDFEMYTRQALQYNHVMTGRCFKIAWQFCVNLRQHGIAREMLTGEIMDEKEMIAEIERDKSDGQTLINLMRWKIHGCFWFRDYEEAVRIIQEMNFHKKAFEDALPGLGCTASLYLHCALSCISIARTNKSERQHLLKMSKFFLSRLKEWNKKGNPNTLHYQPLVEAELLTFKADDGEAKRKFDSSIHMAGRLGLVQDQAIAHERLGDHCLRLGYQNDARYHFDSALELFKYWGADARADLLASDVSDAAPAKEVVAKQDLHDDASALTTEMSGFSKKLSWPQATGDSSDCKS
ncbi:Transcriptional regulator [Seminavis robusta]|uniref:Transcriptional regulator n=1 Tax=Seminavis robusta TaxID=568900 RepID=A0A9N8H6T2_9STRA|nr:Transcriptional regulator [Seminavis robusta]|eukprot:Sro180_g078850.1 Transcriptional regulator (1244) ;mRNA; f:76972-81222